MPGRVMVKPVSKLIKDEFRRLDGLNFRENGGLQQNLRDAKRYYPDKADVVMIKERGTVLSWALVFPPDGNHARRNARRTAYFYTRKNLRGEGYASRVMKTVQKIEPNPHVVPHSDDSGKFFARHKKTVHINRNNLHYLDASDE